MVALFVICVVIFTVLLIHHHKHLHHMSFKRTVGLLGDKLGMLVLFSKITIRSEQLSSLSASQAYPRIDQMDEFQLVLRDNQIVPVPILLLVDGDVIVLKPGQTVNVKCSLLTDGKVSRVGTVRFLT